MSYICDICEYEDGGSGCWASNCINGSSFKPKACYAKIKPVKKDEPPVLQKCYCPFCGSDLTELIKILKK